MSQSLLNNSNFKNNNNYIFWKREKQKVFFLFKFYKNKKFLRNFVQAKAFFYFLSVISWIFPYSIFISFLIRIIENNDFYFQEIPTYFMLFAYIFYFLISYFLYKLFIKNKLSKKNWTYILKKGIKKINIDKYFEPKKINYPLKNRVLNLIEKHYMILTIINFGDKKSFIKEK